MSVDAKTVRRIANLSRIKVEEDRIEPLGAELNTILGFIAQLEEVDVEGVEPMTSVIPATLRVRKDAVTDGGYADKIVANAPLSEDNFFQVPKVIE